MLGNGWYHLSDKIIAFLSLGVYWTSEYRITYFILADCQLFRNVPKTVHSAPFFINLFPIPELNDMTVRIIDAKDAFAPLALLNLMDEFDPGQLEFLLHRG